MEVTRGTLYALYVLVYFQLQPKGHVADLHTLSETLEIPDSYLSKILQQLHRSGYLISQLGSRGGYRLSRDVQNTSMREIMVAMQGEPILQECLREHYDCNRFKKCAIIHHVRDIQKVVDQMLDALTIGRLAAGMEFQERQQEVLHQQNLGVH